MAGQSVLAIDRDWRMRKLIRANLEAIGLVVQEAVSGPHGAELLREYRPDLILLDMDLPDGDAFRLMALLPVQAGSQRPTIVAMSNEPAGRWVVDHEQVVSCLRKPFSAASLLEQVQQALDRRQSGE